MGVVNNPCLDGDRSQMIGAFTVPSPTSPISRQNLIPLTWAVSAYVGNGLAGVRVQSEEGGVGVLHVLVRSATSPSGSLSLVPSLSRRLFSPSHLPLFLLLYLVRALSLSCQQFSLPIFSSSAFWASALEPDLTHFLMQVDNVELGAGGKRQANGYFRFTVATEAEGALRVQLQQHVHTSTLTGNVTISDTGALVSNFSIFVNADLDLPVVVLQCAYGNKSSTFRPALEWVSVNNKTGFSWQNTTTPAGDLLAFGAFPTKTLTAAAVIAKAAAQPPSVLEADTAAWWHAYWQESFITLPVTKVEALYYVEMYRFPAADRVVLQGLMGAFGPTDNYNLWGGV
jgi:hypothetical protein